MISLGDTFWAQNPNSNNPPHLYFVISDPSRNAGHVLLVNVTTHRAGADESCPLQADIHPCVKTPSVIQYAGTIFPEARMVEQAVYKGIFMAAPPAELSLVRRILQGALASRHLRSQYRPVVEAELNALGQG